MRLFPSVLLPIALALPACVYAPMSLGGPAGPGRFTEVVLERADSWLTDDKVLVIGVDGVIAGAEEGGVFGSDSNLVAEIVAQLEQARRDPDVKAVVLRLNSPGGTVTASDQLHREVKAFKDDTGLPVLACMLDVAASGAYYVAVAADTIYAHPTSITGSIGVVTHVTNVEGLFELVGLEQQTFKSGEFKDMGSAYRKMTDEERDLLQDLVLSMHGRFLDVVTAGRPQLTRPQVERLADGRVYTAQQALANGLVDALGYMDDVIAAARGAANLEDAAVVGYRLGWGTPANLYASTRTRPARAVLDLGLDRVLPSPGLRVMYLWAPGVVGP